jgi:hypothetical protein
VVTRPKRLASYTPAPARVRLCKPARRREAVFGYKTAGDNGEADVVERTAVYKPRKRELGSPESNGWCRPHY